MPRKKAQFKFGQVVGFVALPHRFGKVRNSLYEGGSYSYEVMCQSERGTDEHWWSEGDLRPLNSKEIGGGS